MIDFEESAASEANPGICRNLRTKYLVFTKVRRSNLCPVDDIYSVKIKQKKILSIYRQDYLLYYSFFIIQHSLFIAGQDFLMNNE